MMDERANETSAAEEMDQTSHPHDYNSDTFFGGGEPIVTHFSTTPYVYLGYDMYTLYEVEHHDKHYDAEKFEYIGEISENNDARQPTLWSNHVPPASKVYRIDALTIYVEYLYNGENYRAVGQMNVDSLPPASVFVNNRLFYVFISDMQKRQTDDLVYLGQILASTTNGTLVRSKSFLPDKEFETFGLPIGTDIYEIDESSLYLENIEKDFFQIGFATSLP